MAVRERRGVGPRRGVRAAGHYGLPEGDVRRPGAHGADGGEDRVEDQHDDRDDAAGAGHADRSRGARVDAGSEPSRRLLEGPTRRGALRRCEPIEKERIGRAERDFREARALRRTLRLAEARELGRDVNLHRVHAGDAGHARGPHVERDGFAEKHCGRRVGPGRPSRRRGASSPGRRADERANQLELPGLVRGRRAERALLEEELAKGRGRAHSASELHRAAFIAADYIARKAGVPRARPPFENTGRVH